jgi:hypothetical protein
MRITQRQFNDASDAAFSAAEASPDEVVLSDVALLAFASSLGIEIIELRDVTSDDALVWTERTIADVREDDVIRPVGAPESQAARVMSIGPACAWHVNHGAGADAQYRPNEHRSEWSARRITLQPLADPDAAPLAPEHGMRIDFPVLIRTSVAELRAIEALGGWGNRIS